MLGIIACLALAAAAGPRAAMIGKLAGNLVMPTGLLWLFLLLRSGVAYARRDAGSARAYAALFVVYTAVGSTWVGQRLVGALERGLTPVVRDAAGPFDAVFVLGGGVDRDPVGGPQLVHAGDRAVLGARLFHAGRTPLLVSSGSSPPGSAQQTDASALTATLWSELGVPRAAIVTLPEPYNTATELRAIAALVRARGWGRAGVVTSAWHMRRVLRLAEGAGVSLEPLPCDFRGGRAWDGLPSLVPQGRGFLLVGLAAWEWVGAAAGR